MASDNVKIMPSPNKAPGCSDGVKLITSPEEEEMEGTARVCGLCLKTQSKYNCPRCNTPYCNLDCYKSDKHRDCSEMFYKDCFMEGLKDCSVDPEEKRKVMEMISRAEADPDLCDLEDVDDLDDRLENLDLEKDTDQVWERLTEKEKKDFEHMITDGRLGNLVELWTPWWKQDVPVVRETNQTEDENSKPRIKSNIPNMSTLIKLKPSSDTRYNLLNILYSYVYVCRLHNGDHVSMATESAEDLIKLSDVLGQGRSFGSVRDAIDSCFSRLQSKGSGFESSMEGNISVLTDMKDIIACPLRDNPLCYILTALLDLYDIFRRAYKTSLKPDVKEQQDIKDGETVLDKKQLFQCKKKCEFMLSWSQSYGMSMQGLIPELDIEYALMKGDLELFNQTKTELEMKWGGRVKPRRGVLVEEL